MLTTDFGDLIAERIRIQHRALAERWFERLLEVLPVAARDVFPTETLLDHIPALILEISEYLREPAEGAIGANTAILDKARELGALRYRQRASLHQVLREYQILNGILVTFVIEESARLHVVPDAAESVRLVARLHESVDVLSQATVEAFVTLYTQTIAEQNERLEQFTRMAAHEWRQPLSALEVGVTLLRRGDLDTKRAERTLDVVERNVRHLVELTSKLETIARVQGSDDSLVVQEVSAKAVAQEAIRQVKEMADARDVAIEIADELPSLAVDVGRLELVLVNLLSNAIKYSDPGKPTRLVRISSRRPGDDRQCHIEVSDNGIGIPQEALATIFQRFTRAHTGRENFAHLPGVGLGLSIVEDCMHAIGGRIDVQSVEGEGTTFTMALPRRPPGS